jgi:hypothetical protein
MSPHRWSPLTLAVALASAPLAWAVAAPATASAQSRVARRTIGDYSFGGGGRVRVDVDGARIALFAADGSGSRVLLYLDPASTDRWLATADALMRGGGRTAAGAETQTPPLTHADPSVGGSVVLTREDVPRRRGTTTQYYLTAMGDADHLALLPLSTMEARIVTAALHRAVDEARGR